MLIWFQKRLDLYALLEKWRKTGSNYDPDQPIDATWQVDGYEVPLGHAHSAYEPAVHRLFRYDLYPSNVLEAAADFIKEDRMPAFGDRIVQRIRVIPGILSAVTMNIVSSVWHEHDRRGFTAVTSEEHYLMGEWTATVSRKRSGEAVLMIHAISRPSKRMPVFAGPLARRLQVRAQYQAIDHFSNASERE